MTGTPLRRRLFLLTAACILPVALLGGISLYALKRQQSHQSDRVGIELARTVANAVDAELRRSIATLETLSTSLRLDERDDAAFRVRAQRVLEIRPEWAAITLFDLSGRSLVDTRHALGTPLPDVMERASFERVVRTGASDVGSLTLHAGGEWLFAVRAPVVRDGRVRFVLTALVRPVTIHDLLVRMDAPEDWLISIVDANGRRVARSKAHEENLAGRLSPTVQQVVARGGREGAGMAYALEGGRIFTPYSRVSDTGWLAVLGIPTDRIDAAVFRSIAAYGGGILLSILLGGFGGLWVARTITRPIARLRASAEALGHRQPLPPPMTSIQELHEVGVALRGAADELAAAEQEREALLRKERHARETAEGADRAKDEFMAIVSHELRTPLNAVYGWARLLQTGQIRDVATIERAMDAIVRNSDVQVQLIDDLLDLSRITSGKMRLHVERVAIEGVLQGALDAVRPAADAKGIALRVAIDEGAGVIAADPARLQQVVWNLLMNGVKFTPRGGEVRLEARRTATGVAIVVSDTGQGISPQMLPYLFERFRQADSSSTRTHGGLGLGLSLVKHLVELHGGTVAAESGGEGQGASFTVELPDRAVPAAAPGAPATQAAQERFGMPENVVRLDGLRVLVADDDPEVLGLVEAILARAGAEVRACASAATAFALLHDWRPDVLVSDIGMPGEDGYALIRRIRALPEHEGGATPAIALTGFGRPQDRQRAIDAGYNMHVPKPVDPLELTSLTAAVTGLGGGAFSPRSG
jgi:signal transduction histidine kinase/ActR/RegA family two-component response regulator